MATLTKTAKIVQVLARFQFKDDARKVVYEVRSSQSADTYHTYLFNGRATSCDCPARKPCYHMTQLETREQARRDQEATTRAYREMAWDNRF